MDSGLRFLWLSLLVVVSVLRAQSQLTRLREGVGSCSQVILEDFGNTTSLSLFGILHAILGIEVKVNRFNLVCESIGLTRNSASSISAVVEYDQPGLPGSESGPLRGLIGQVTLDCKEDGNGFGGGVRSKLKTARILANFSTSTDLKCGKCVDPTVNSSANAFTHCLSCKAECNEGQMRCTGLEADQCCNWFSNNVCVNKCPGDTIGDPVTFDCGCGPVNVTNGVVTYTKKFLMGSIANISCNEGYVKLSPGSSTCMRSGWDGITLKCILSPSTTVLPSTTELSSVIKSICDTSCITAIVMSAVGIIILVAITSGVAYGIYTYLNHPNTKLSIHGTSDNFHTVGKDNPLYMNPDIIVQPQPDSAVATEGAQ